MSNTLYYLYLKSRYTKHIITLKVLMGMTIKRLFLKKERKSHKCRYTTHNKFR